MAAAGRRLRYVDPSGRQGPVRSSMKPRVQIRDIAIEARLVGSPRQPVNARCGILLEFEERRFEVLSVIWCRSAVNFSFFLCLAARRMRSNAGDTLSRSCAGACFVAPHSPRPPPFAPPTPQLVAQLCSSASQLL